ncbi:MAG: small ribosomal subunit Rsm22 family protein [Alphaproteobacteria bacterium]|nr:small ribosomal subunit Rsm22 family protein [Alphaproteobacteria bacterium]
MPATYAANCTVFDILADIAPDFTPQTLCDVGAGPGTAAFAAFSVWGDYLSAAQLWEPNAPLRELGQKLAGLAGMSVNYQNARLENFMPEEKFDLVTASYVLNELPIEAQEKAVPALWQAAGQALVLVETGTPLGFKTLTKARDILRAEADAHIAAPCPHAHDCPLAAGDNWCHFSVRVQRPSLHRLVKPGASLSYEDEKFCYLIVTRGEYARPQARVVGAPKGGKVLTLPLCCSDGVFRMHQSSKRDAAYGQLKRLDWGEGLEEFTASE